MDNIRYLKHSYTLADFLSDLVSRGESTYIKDNIKEFIEGFDIEYLTKYHILEQLKKIAPEEFSNYHSLIVASIFDKSLISTDPPLLTKLTEIVGIIAKNEKTDISNIKYIGIIDNSIGAKLGNKVIKVGHRRITYEIPFHRRLLQPVIRRKIPPQEGNPFRDDDLFIEITEYLTPDNSITEEDVYSVYKELRDDGIVWTSPRKEYLGRLEHENTIHSHYTEPLDNTDKSFGFIPETIKKVKPLQKGDLVITNLDHLFREKDLKVVNQDGYAIRYQEEKNKTAYSEER